MTNAARLTNAARQEVAPRLKRGANRTPEDRAADMKYPALKQQLLDDAAEVAASIYDMLGIKQACRFNDIWRLCEEHGCRPLVCPVEGQRKWGLFTDWPGDISDASDGGLIVLSDNMTFAESCAVMVHELAHRILYSGWISDWALEHNHRRYDLHDWQEAVARAVERLFLEAGGTGLLPPRF